MDWKNELPSPLEAGIGVATILGLWAAMYGGYILLGLVWPSSG